MNLMGQAVVNDTLPTLVPMMTKDAGITTTPIPVFEALGGRSLACPDLFPDGCHPNDLGYLLLAQAVCSGLGLDVVSAASPLTAPTAEVEHQDLVGPKGLRLAVSPPAVPAMQRQIASAALPVGRAMARPVAAARQPLAVPRTPLAALRSLASARARDGASPVRLGKASARSRSTVARARPRAANRTHSPVRLRVARAPSPIQLRVIVPAPPMPPPVVLAR
mmetsp:Transcript_138519/g.359980  ORF Transcript_138519/g.359980 Transcript_138519/m.359980 type:complete len:221 (+) Transcript_138519:1-663(+)